MLIEAHEHEDINSKIRYVDIHYLASATLEAIRIGTLVYASSNFLGTYFLMEILSINKGTNECRLGFYDLAEMRRYVHQGGRIDGNTNRTWTRAIRSVLIAEDENEINYWLKG